MVAGITLVFAFAAGFLAYIQSKMFKAASITEIARI
jgi:hypothetical protein